MVGLVVSRVGQLVASPVAVLQVAPTLAAAVGTAVVGVKRPCVVEHPALEHHVDVAPWIEGGSSAKKQSTPLTTLDRLMRLEFYQHVQVYLICITPCIAILGTSLAAFQGNLPSGCCSSGAPQGGPASNVAPAGAQAENSGTLEGVSCSFYDKGR